MIAPPHNGLHMDSGEFPGAAELLEAADGLERDLDLAEGSVIRELTSLLLRRRRFEGLRRDHDVRLNRRR